MFGIGAIVTAVMTVFLPPAQNPVPLGRSTSRRKSRPSGPSPPQEIEMKTLRSRPQPLPTALSSRYHLMRQIGVGATATVFHALDKNLRREHAVKVVAKADLSGLQEIRAVRREATVLHKLGHKNVIKMNHAKEDHDFIFMATEFCAGGDMSAMLERTQSGFAEEVAISMMKQVFCGLSHVHLHGFAHRDMKPSNILVGPNGVLKIADFGLAHWREEEQCELSNHVCGSAPFTAPEVLRGDLYHPQRADVWSCGVLLYALLTKVMMFWECPERWSEGRVAWRDVRRALDAPEMRHISMPCRNLLESLLSIVPWRRPSAELAEELCDEALTAIAREKEGRSWRDQEDWMLKPRQQRAVVER